MLDWLTSTLTALLLALLSVWGSPSAPPSETPLESATSSVTTASSTGPTHTVARVIDGDTIDLASGERVRLLGIDTPEREACYYAESSAWLRAWIAGADVRLERDVRNRDDYGRLLRYVYAYRTPEGVATTTPQLVNRALVERGYARTLPIGPDDRYRSELYAAENAAQAADRGRHGACS